MTIEKVKNEIENIKGKQISIKYSLGRNKYETYKATIEETYDYIFLVKLNREIYPEIKSFKYSDVITKIIKIDV